MFPSENLKEIKKHIPSHIKIVAVSKTKPIESIREVYRTGHRIFGENKVQELALKYTELPKDIEWHLIGHLQSNKVRYIAPYVSLIHSVDSLKILEVINKEAQKNDRIIDCLLQIHIASEETKFGLNKVEAESIIRSEVYASLNNIRITGLMGMATYTENIVTIRNEFRSLAEMFKEFKYEYFAEDDHFKDISMGMSGDYKIAIEEGATIVRLGSIIFGEREKNISDPQD